MVRVGDALLGLESGLIDTTCTGDQYAHPWHAGHPLVIFDPANVETRVAANEDEKKEFGDIVLVVNSRAQRRQRLEKIEITRRKSVTLGEQTPFHPKKQTKKNQIVPRTLSKKNYTGGLEGYHARVGSALFAIRSCTSCLHLLTCIFVGEGKLEEQIDRIAEVVRHLSSASPRRRSINRKAAQPSVLDVKGKKRSPPGGKKHRRHHHRAKPRYEDCMAKIRDSIMDHRSELATMTARELVVHLASALRDRHVLSKNDVEFVKANVPDQSALEERIERIRRHNLEMILSTASDSLQTILMDRR